MQVKTTHDIHLSILEFTFFLAHPMSCHQHGIVLRSKFESESYCGTRLPWSMITKGDTLVLYLMIREHKDYNLQVYYSSFHANWISDISSILNIYNEGFSSFAIGRPTFKILSYEYYVMSHPDNYLQIYVKTNTYFKGSLTIHDGPGSLSPKILENKGSQTTGWKTETRAFWAFIHIMLFDFDIISYMPLLKITMDYNIRIIPLCANEDRLVIVAKSNISKNSVCMDKLTLTQHYITLTVETFLFSGPTMVTDLSDSVCQYGGLLVQFRRSRTKEYGFCEPLHDYTIYTGEYTINVILVWFAGYSSGHFRGFLGKSHCKSYYPEFTKSPIEPIYQHGEATSLHGCTVFVSPSLITEDKSPFYIKLGPPAMGSADITVTHLNTLSSCEPEYSKPEHRKDVPLTVQTISSDNWPLNAKSVENYTEIPYSRHVHRYFLFQYLNSAKIVLPHTCKTGLIKSQLAVIAQISTCIYEVVEPSQVIINKIPSLVHTTCGDVVYRFTPTGVNGRSYMNFIHPDRGYMYVDDISELHVNYYKCPMECRYFRYKTIIRSEDGKTVFEYTTRVGQVTHIGRHHRGFRVTILKPDQLCQQHMNCELELFRRYFAPNDNKSDDHPTLHFYDKR